MSLNFYDLSLKIWIIELKYVNKVTCEKKKEIYIYIYIYIYSDIKSYSTIFFVC